MVLELKIKNKKEVIDMASTNKTSLGLNMWEASDKPVRQDFVNDNVIINEKITKLNSDLKYIAYSPSNSSGVQLAVAIRRQGNLCCINMNGFTNVKDLKSITIDSKYSTTALVSIPVIYSSSGTFYNGYCAISNTTNKIAFFVIMNNAIQEISDGTSWEVMFNAIWATTAPY